jgi:hypothetical protein
MIHLNLIVHYFILITSSVILVKYVSLVGKCIIKFDYTFTNYIGK